MSCQLLRGNQGVAVDWFKDLFNAFNTKFFLVLVITQHILKGLLAGGGGAGWIGSSIPYILKDRQPDTKFIDLTAYRDVAMTPWCIKPIMGVFSDFFTIFGYHKRYYFAAAACVFLVSGYANFFLLLKTMNMLQSKFPPELFACV